MTYQQLADLSGVSLSSVERILTGKSKNTSFEILRPLVLALGGNMDDLARAADGTDDIHPETWGKGPDVPTVPDKARELATAADLNAMTDMFTAMLREKDANYEKHIHALVERHKLELDAVRAEHTQDLAALKDKHKDSISALKTEYEKERDSYERALIRREIFCYVAFGILVLFLIVWIVFLYN